MSMPLRALLVAAVLLAVACSPAVIDPVAPAGLPLVRITTRGGECPSSPCEHVIAIARDGRVVELSPRSVEIGVVPQAAFQTLDQTLRTTDFAAMRSRPFVGECPVNFDGQEVIYEIGAPGGVERIASCETEIDPLHPAFGAVREALEAAGVI
jgi:hypothetical protein